MLNLARILDRQLFTPYRLAASPIAELDGAVCDELCWMTELQTPAEPNGPRWDDEDSLPRYGGFTCEANSHKQALFLL